MLNGYANSKTITQELKKVTGKDYVVQNVSRALKRLTQDFEYLKRVETGNVRNDYYVVNEPEMFYGVLDTLESIIPIRLIDILRNIKKEKDKLDTITDMTLALKVASAYSYFNAITHQVPLSSYNVLNSLMKFISDDHEFTNKRSRGKSFRKFVSEYRKMLNDTGIKEFKDDFITS
tara:strand:- start:1758 stop:2285 length:528 start_codon:yes stop_codon:yes gene_type:complete